MRVRLGLRLLKSRSSNIIRRRRVVVFFLFFRIRLMRVIRLFSINLIRLSNMRVLLGKWRYSVVSETSIEAVSFVVVIRWFLSLDFSISVRD